MPITIIKKPKLNLLPNPDTAPPADVDSTEVLQELLEQDKQPLWDRFSDLVHETENMNRQEAREVVLQLDGSQGEASFKLGGALDIIRRNKWYEPHQTFNEYVEIELSMKPARANALARNYDVLVETGISDAEVKDIGWSKLRTIVPVLSKENSSFWLQLARKHSRKELEKQVRVHQKKGIDGSDVGQSKQVWKHFKLYAEDANLVEQAIAKAKQQGETDVDAVALSYICLDFMGRPTKASENLKPIEIAVRIASLLVGRSEPTIETIFNEVWKRLKAKELEDL